MLKADRQFTYAEVSATLKQMQTIGGDRIVLSIERRQNWEVIFRLA